MGAEKDEDSEVPNRQVGEVKNHRNTEMASSDSSNLEKDSKDHYLTLDDCNFDTEGMFISCIELHLISFIILT